jgi:hypothetical protein
VLIPNSPNGITNQAVGLATQVPADGTELSNIVRTQGLTFGAFGLTSDQAGSLSVQRYLDANGQIPLGSPLTATLTAAVANSVSWTDGLPAVSLQITVTNSAGSAANLSNITLNLLPTAAPQSPVTLTAIAEVLTGVVLPVSGLISMPFNYLINSVDLLADQAGSCQFDIRRLPATAPLSQQYLAALSNPTTVGTSIVGSDPPELVDAQSMTDSTLSGWTKTGNVGDQLLWLVSSASAIDYVQISLSITQTS